MDKHKLASRPGGSASSESVLVHSVGQRNKQSVRSRCMYIHSTHGRGKLSFSQGIKLSSHPPSIPQLLRFSLITNTLLFDRLIVLFAGRLLHSLTWVPQSRLHLLAASPLYHCIIPLSIPSNKNRTIADYKYSMPSIDLSIWGSSHAKLWVRAYGISLQPSHVTYIIDSMQCLYSS